MKTLEQLQSSDFLPYLNQTFTVQLEGVEPIRLDLILVRETGKPFRPGARQPFSLQFLGPVSSQYLAQHIFPLEHPELGTLEIFLVALGPDEGRMRYEAIFS